MKMVADDPDAFVLGSRYTPGGTLKNGCCQRSLHCSPPVVELATIFILSATILLALLEECNPDASNDIAGTLGRM